jgi:hypothetical protein
MQTEWNGVHVLDRRCEESGLLPLPQTPLQWLASGIDERHWRVELSAAARAEVERAADYIVANPVNDLQRRESEFAWPGFRDIIANLKSIVDAGVGFAVLDRLPIDDYPLDTIVEIYWLLGQLIGRPVAQKWNGEMIYRVHDSGQGFRYGVRGSRTSVELVFHTDNAFAMAVPDYVGLLCVRPAKSGGISRFCSLYTLHEMLRERYPQSLRRLYESMLFDRQKEHAEGGVPVCLAPFFACRGERLSVRANTSLVRKGYEVAGIEMDTVLQHALAAVDECCREDGIWYEAPIERGQVQYLNNHEIGHYRSAFEDFEDPDYKRHLFRLWHRDSGSVCYDGIAMVG